MPRGLRLMMIVLAVSALVAGCGGGSADGDVAPERPATAVRAPGPVLKLTDEQQIRELHDQYIETVFRGDPAEACALLSPRARRSVEEDPDNAQFGETCEAQLTAGLALVTSFYGEGITARLTQLRITGDTARGLETYSAPNSESQIDDEFMNFERVDGTWRIGPED